MALTIIALGITILITAIFCSYAKTNTPSNLVINWLLSISLITLLSLRGTSFDFDSMTYENIFNSILQDDFIFDPSSYITSIEPGFLAISYIVIALGFGFSTVQLFFAAASILIYKKILSETSVKLFPIALFIYYCTGFLVREFTQIRFGLSVAIGSLSMILYFKEQKTKSFIALIISSLFHASALLVPCFIISMRLSNTIKYSKIKYTYAFILLLSVLISASLNYCTDFFSFFSIGRFDRYTGTDELGDSLPWLIQCVIFLASTLIIKPSSIKHHLLLPIAVTTLALCIVFYNFQILQRFSIYGFIFISITATQLVSELGWKRNFVVFFMFPLFSTSLIFKISSLIAN
ncbi:EpsG family protein [Chromobacterium amazonense]|uniref:EpsG family protein n=1 Tax=Chromobacterium amazonense TaxID=1382803 RepID=UPI0009F1D68D|nr:EpsG family protein [Chromobacterium amazonense]